MTKGIIYCCLFGILPVTSCSDSNAEKSSEGPFSQETKKTETISKTQETGEHNDGIIGDWKLALETYDNNHNKKLDEEERKKAFANHYFYRFAADGSCIISPFAANQLKSGFKGHYTITEKDGKKVITTIWDEAEERGKQEAQYTIISVDKDELVLLETLGNRTFWIFKRV
jgi:hypothetical protein